MRWRTSPVFGEVRHICMFLWFPVSIQNETRWLETVYIKQQYTEGYLESFWANISWATKEEYEKYVKELSREREEMGEDS